MSNSSPNLTGVPETLMITLHARSIETQRANPIINDPKAVQITNNLDYDFGKFSRKGIIPLSCILRAKEIDRIVQNFITTHPNAIIVNLGAGLCSRFVRLDKGTIFWYEIDFPEVIELRRQLFEENRRYHFISKSILDFTWIDHINRLPKQALMVILEGVTPYLKEAENRKIIHQISRHLSPAEVVLDIINRRASHNTKWNRDVAKTNATFQWGIDNSRDLEGWGPGISLRTEVFYFKQLSRYRDRLPFWPRSLAFILAVVLKNAARIVHLGL